MQSFEPIAAISTPYGKGGIAVIRMSGDNAISLAEKMFVSHSGRMLTEVKGGTAVYGDIFMDGERIDDGIATVFRSPNSFTGEDTVEVSCHGGMLITQQVLAAALKSGFRIAGAGEFSERAFLNGKMSLTKAEAIIDLIDAENAEQLKLSSSVSEGVLSSDIDSVCDILSNTLASVYAYIDYPDEDLTDMSVSELIDAVDDVKGRVGRLCSSYKTGRAVKEGVRTAIVGKPNAGKSSLLNRLLGYDRAIVTDVPGTTRDTVEETASVGRVTLRLCDTAGIRATDDEVERIGIERSLRAIDEAELIIAVFDSTSPIDGLDCEVIERLRGCEAEIVCVINKSDIGHCAFELPYKTFSISAKSGLGIDELCSYISELYVSEKLDYRSTPIISNARQYAAASKALKCLENAFDALKCGYTQDVAGMDLESALSSLKEIDGRDVTEDITDKIFSRFCVGK
jgi:tRNA modification GTPase